MTEQQWTIFLLLLVLSAVSSLWGSLIWLGAAGVYVWTHQKKRDGKS